MRTTGRNKNSMKLRQTFPIPSYCRKNQKALEMLNLIKEIYCRAYQQKSTRNFLPLISPHVDILENNSGRVESKSRWRWTGTGCTHWQWPDTQWTKLEKKWESCTEDSGLLADAAECYQSQCYLYKNNLVMASGGFSHPATLWILAILVRLRFNPLNMLAGAMEFIYNSYMILDYQMCSLWIRYMLQQLFE